MTATAPSRLVEAAPGSAKASAAAAAAAAPTSCSTPSAPTGAGTVSAEANSHKGDDLGLPRTGDH